MPFQGFSVPFPILAASNEKPFRSLVSSAPTILFVQAHGLGDL